MEKRNDSAQPSDAQGGPKAKGNTLPMQGETQESVPRMPHERDESADSQEASETSRDPRGKIAHDDLAKGLVDTDKGPALDKTYDKVREGADSPKKKFSP
jgi:hypothetical protein